MIPSPLPLDIMGRQTTKEQWEKYELELKNHEAKIESKREFMTAVLTYREVHGFDKTLEHFNTTLDQCLSMNRPNPPDYIRAAND